MSTSTATGKPLTSTAQTRAKAYTINRAAAGGFVRRGLRAYFEYRDLGIETFILSGYPHRDECARFGSLVLPHLR